MGVESKQREARGCVCVCLCAGDISLKGDS